MAVGSNLRPARVQRTHACLVSASGVVDVGGALFVKGDVRVRVVVSRRGWVVHQLASFGLVVGQRQVRRGLASAPAAWGTRGAAWGKRGAQKASKGRTWVLLES